MDETVNCQETEELILNAFETPLSTTEQNAVDEHCSHCSTCTQFAAVQSEVDGRLRQSIKAPKLNTDFPRHLMERIRRRQRASIPAWYPDVAYSIGAFVALVVSSMVLPFRPETVLTVGVSMCVAAYLLQSFILLLVNEPND